MLRLYKNKESKVVGLVDTYDSAMTSYITITTGERNEEYVYVKVFRLCGSYKCNKPFWGNSLSGNEKCPHCEHMSSIHHRSLAWALSKYPDFLEGQDLIIFKGLILTR